MIRKVTGVRSTLRKMYDDFAKEGEVEFSSAKRRLLNNVRDETPVDTGKARDGWSLKGDALENDVEYVLPLNNGTVNRPPRFFIEAAIVKTRGVKLRGSAVKTKTDPT